jgi:hypothetical protein
MDGSGGTVAHAELDFAWPTTLSDPNEATRSPHLT